MDCRMSWTRRWGAVRRMAARVGVATPLNDMVHGALEGQITARG